MSANRKPPSARVSATRCSSITTTVAPETGFPSLSATRPESVSPADSATVRIAARTVIASAFLRCRTHRRHAQVLQHPVECREIGRLEARKLRQLLVEPAGQLLEHLLLLLGRRGVGALHHGVERQQLIVDLNRPVERSEEHTSE